MTQEAFIKVLDEKGYSYKIKGDSIVVTHKRDVNLESLTSLPPGVVFRNGGYVYLESLTSIPSGVEFRNGGSVNLKSLTGNWFHNWSGNIKGIDPKRLLNLMINKEIFER